MGGNWFMRDIKCSFTNEIHMNNIMEIEKQIDYKFTKEFPK